jgi:hypothetical protein
MKPVIPNRSTGCMLVRWMILAGIVSVSHPLTSIAQTLPPIGPSSVTPIPDTVGANPGSGITLTSCPGCSSSPPSGTSYGPGILGYGKFGGPGGCPSCGDNGCGEGCGENGCTPGRQPCDTCEGQTRLTRLFCALHNALSCPDPCYEPQWTDPANASLFTPAVRPGTYMQFQWDSGVNLTQPDRGEYFWAAIGKRGPGKPETQVSYNELSLYAEVGTNRFSFFVNTPYINLNGAVNGGAGNIGDLTLGTKTMLVDSELLQMTFMLSTTLPTGDPGDGTGTGHVSLTPSLLWAIKLYPETYWQGQAGYVMPFGGTQGYESGVFIFNNSLNHVLCRPLKDTELIGTIETSGWTFTSGGYTDPISGLRVSGNNTTYFSMGPGLRLVISDKVDIGFGVEFALTQDHFASTLYRTQFRWRF